LDEVLAAADTQLTNTSNNIYDRWRHFHLNAQPYEDSRAEARPEVITERVRYNPTVRAAKEHETPRRGTTPAKMSTDARRASLSRAASRVPSRSASIARVATSIPRGHSASVAYQYQRAASPPVSAHVAHYSRSYSSGVGGGLGRISPRSASGADAHIDRSVKMVYRLLNEVIPELERQASVALMTPSDTMSPSPAIRHAGPNAALGDQSLAEAHTRLGRIIEVLTERFGPTRVVSAAPTPSRAGTPNRPRADSVGSAGGRYHIAPPPAHARSISPYRQKVLTGGNLHLGLHRVGHNPSAAYLR
jgi:hypothetical protein